MKIFWVVFAIGLTGLYFVNMAMLKMPFLSWEWGKHAAIRFFLGFFILGVNAFYAHKLKFTSALKVILAIAFLDYLYDYFIETYRLNFEIILHGLYMLVWGSIMGYLACKDFNNKE
ncbi:hypothetical protein [Methylomonas koyamae]|uniref:Uncharacterized protein n=1 Tax=Methylomonas koyamae TaxID=702114 RepID=A0A177NJH5_9GAMM|nr:hypothetical protein [Methylomonas koyamae]OAI17573.1 hypothetical protein A1355_08010 [Methylomonas koyamae]